MSDESTIRDKFEAVKDEVNSAISLLKQSHGIEHAEIIEGRIYNVLVNLVAALSPTRDSVGVKRVH